VGIHVALNHKTSYRYDRPVSLGPQTVRLRPAPHCRTPILSYSLTVTPKKHFINWQQDSFSNFLGRLVFPEKTTEFQVEVDLVAEMIIINPFDFFLAPEAEHFPLSYDAGLASDLSPYLARRTAGPELSAYLAGIDRGRRQTIDFLVDLNRRLSQTIRYLIRLEPNVQSCEQTLALGSGSCRDTAWLLVNLLRHLGLAARFVSGYLIQLAPDVKSLDGPSGPAADFTDLHAWTEVYLPGAGWVGLDPTSGLLAGEGHIPLACSPEPQSAAPISGALDECQVEFGHQMTVRRILEAPRATRPYPEEVWQAIASIGDQVDQTLAAADVRLTMGGEPTFVSIDDMDGAQWTTAALGEEKQRLAESLIKSLRRQWAPGGLLHHGQGKWYPGESLPRWALGCYWRADGRPVWQDDRWQADTARDYGFGAGDAQRFIETLADALGVSRRYIREGYEDILYFLHQEQRLPVNMDPGDPRLDDAEERARLVATFRRGLGAVVGYVLPLQYGSWKSGPWPFRGGRMFLLPGDSPAGLRLPLASLPGSRRPTLPWSIPWTPWPSADPCPIRTRANRLSKARPRKGRAPACGPSPRPSTIPRRWPANRPPGWCARPCACSPGTAGCMSSCRPSPPSRGIWN
jgi:transglutaminase-like putative cysteine protease